MNKHIVKSVLPCDTWALLKQPETATLCKLEALCGIFFSSLDLSAKQRLNETEQTSGSEFDAVKMCKQLLHELVPDFHKHLVPDKAALRELISELINQLNEIDNPNESIPAALKLKSIKNSFELINRAIKDSLSPVGYDYEINPHDQNLVHFTRALNCPKKPIKQEHLQACLWDRTAGWLFSTNHQNGELANAARARLGWVPNQKGTKTFFDGNEIKGEFKEGEPIGTIHNSGCLPAEHPISKLLAKSFKITLRRVRFNSEIDLDRHHGSVDLKLIPQTPDAHPELKSSYQGPVSLDHCGSAYLPAHKALLTELSEA